MVTEAASERVKTLTLVTCLYDLVKRGSTQHRTVDWMLANDNYVLSLARKLFVFTEPELENEILRRREGRPTTVITVPFETLLGKERVAASVRGALQDNASKWKVTPIYVQLMWAKYAMLEVALGASITSHLGWIDLGISHVGKLPQDGRDIFADPSDRPHVHVLRCFDKGAVDHADYWRSVQGHLAGGLVVGDHESMRGLVVDFWRAVDRATAMGLAPLDEGLLSYIVAQRPGDFAYSYGDYEDILRNHDGPWHGDARRRWIVEDARRRGLPDTMEPLMTPVPSQLRSFRPAFSPRSCYLLRDAAEEAYFAQHGGAPEAALISWATQFIRKDQVFVDVGAHVGTWAQHFAQVCRQVHAFEPQRSTFERLCEGARLAELSNVVCHDAALGARGEIDLHVVSADGGGSTARHRRELGEVLAMERVRAAQLDDFGLEDVGLVKIDAEGLEIDILRGATRLLETQRPTLLLEAWDHDWYARERAELVEYVKSIGYGVVPIHNWPQMLLVEPRAVAVAASSSRSAVGSETAATLTLPAVQVGAMQDLLQGLTATLRLSPDRPLLGLVMIVKNESRRISEVLSSYRAYIDAWTILDTGSTDGTQDLIRKELDGIPGALHEEPFVDFATSRNRALELHGTSTVFSIMPNGDVLAGGPELRSFLEARRKELSGAYRVRIAPGHYYHPLVMRTGMGWRYKWRTHECAMGPNVGDAIPGVVVHRDRGARTDEEWRVRWTRDLDLLNRDREADPSDPRPYFYLGQTHECLGQFAQALVFFERRAEMGGYYDEIYEAKFRVAKMKAKLDRPWSEIQQSYLDAYAHDPRRAEPLYAISEHWYDKGQHHIARIFSVAAAELPKPATDLFLDEEIYRWRAADRAAISSFYAGRKDDGRYWADQAVAARPGDERLRANRAFYAQSANELFGSSARAIEFTPEAGWNASNPSIYSEGGRVRCVVRTVNYKIVNGSYVTPPGDIVLDEGRYRGWQVIRTRNFLLDLDADLKTTRVVELVDATKLARTGYPVHGFEDARLFAWNGTWWATATVCDFTEDGDREIALLQLAEDGSVTRAEPLRGPWSAQAQKNWMPFVDGDRARFVYASHPTTIFELVQTEKGNAIAAQSADGGFGHGRLRGGSQGVRIDGGWLFVVHDVAFPGSGRFYLHRFVQFDDQMKLVAMTDPFYFERLGIEFCAGLAQVGDKLVASYAVNDGSARLGVFDWREIRRALRKDFVI